MKFYFNLNVLLQLVLAFLSGDKNKMEYMLYLLKDLPGRNDKTKKNSVISVVNLEQEISSSETKSEKYTLLLER